ncbi:MAG: Na+/H+ antiporter subunit A, partial [Micrococcales bacterium]|nr:Na+/H+ antiporter subunit A [Micrococcales bacterium]
LAVVAPLVMARLGARAFWILAVPPALTAGWAASQYPVIAAGRSVTESASWVSSLGVELAFRLDTLGWLMTLVVSVVGVLVLVYCSAYFDDDEPGLGRFAGCLLAFAGVMFGLVTSDDMLILYIFWELTTVLSYLLIGHRPESRAGRSAAMQALVVTTFGGLAMLIGIILLGEQAGSYRLSVVLAHGEPDTVTAVGVALLLIGALSKSALVPFHFWLPGAMAAPTPVSAYLHAAAMVKAGIYLVARLSGAYSGVPGWLPIVLILGGTTMLVGAAAALRQTDLKQLLAYGTVSQLGFLVVLTGAGTSDAALAGITMLFAHSLFKACLFLVVGTIDHATGTRDLRRLTGLRHKMPLLFVTAVVAAMSMAGLPPMLGFVGKEAAYGAFTAAGSPYSWMVLPVLILGSAVTLAYSLRFVRGAFSDRPDAEPTHVHPPRVTMLAVPALLAGLTLALGPASALLQGPLIAYADTVGPSDVTAHLGLWHGLNLALGLSVFTWALGLGIDAASRGRLLPTATDGEVGLGEASYRAVMRFLDRVSLEVTGAIQRGSLPLSLGLILAVFLALSGGSLLTAGLDWPALPMRVADNGAQLVVAVLVGLAAIVAARSRRRLRAVLLVGATGYGCAYLFLLHGAPDLALTQILVETVSIIVFVLVLRRMSSRFSDDAGRAKRGMRAGFGVLVGIVFAGLAYVAPTARTAPRASTGMAQSAYDFGGGANIVNVILVDMRAWDTMGELSVVLAAATGIASLVFLNEENVAGARRKLDEVRSRLNRAGELRGRADQRWLPEAAGLAPGRSSVILQVVARLAFYPVLMWSIYLLLAGHNLPGGGFAAGLVAGLALTMRYLAGGRDELRAAAPVMPGLLLGTGLFLSAGNGLGSILVGGQALQTWHAYVDLPLLGELHLVSSVIFDIGVYLVVIGLMLDVLRSLGGGLDREIEQDDEHEDDDADPDFDAPVTLTPAPSSQQPPEQGMSS